MQDKRYSRSFEMVEPQFICAERGLVRGVGVANLVDSCAEDGGFYPIV